jgi:hypothetical protein
MRVTNRFALSLPFRHGQQTEHWQDQKAKE